MPPPKLDRILSAETALQPLLAKARELRALAGLLGDYLPPELARQVRVVNFRDGEIVLIAAAPAAAAKLRLLSPSLVNFFSKQRMQVNSVCIRVQPNESRRGEGAPRKTAHLSTLTLDRLNKLYRGMTPSPARDALRTLLERRNAIPAAPAPQKEAVPRPGRKPRP